MLSSLANNSFQQSPRLSNLLGARKCSDTITVRYWCFRTKACCVSQRKILHKFNEPAQKSKQECYLTSASIQKANTQCGCPNAAVKTRFVPMIGTNNATWNRLQTSGLRCSKCVGHSLYGKPEIRRREMSTNRRVFRRKKHSALRA